jgi:hypothetical protein
MAQTFDTSRVGGGTYELAKDANGNYKLQSVGFKQVNKLNLPDLTTGNSTIDKPIVKKPDVADPFKKLATQNQGDGGINNMYKDFKLVPPEAKVKEASVREAGEMTNTTYNAMSDAEKASVAAGTSGMTFRGAGDSTKQYTNPQEYGISETSTDPMDIKEQARLGNEAQYRAGYANAGMTVKMDGPYSMSTAKTYKTPRTISDQNKYLGRTFTDSKTTGLQAVESKVSNAIAKSSVVQAATALGAGMRYIVDAITGKSQTDLNNANKSALTSLGYKTRYELGYSSEPGRIAGNPANNVFAGMNAQSQFGDVSRGAQKRIDTITTNLAKGKYKNPEKKQQQLKDFQKQKDDHDRASAKDKANAKAAKDNRAVDKQGNTMGGSCFIAGTKVTMSDGTLKNIENIVVGDKVKGHKEDNTVIKLDPTLLADRKLYSFNDNEHYFFTSEHPFMTEEGWKSIKPEKTKERDGVELYNQLKGELKIGDKLITENSPIEITNIKSKEINNPDMPLYNFNVSNDNSYVADKYIVHNKGSGTGGRVICTDLHRTGELSTRDWIRDTKFTFTTLSKKHVKGYLLWAEPTVKHIQKYPRYRKMWKHIAQHRANDIAWRLNEGKFDLLGRIYAGIGEPVCWTLGNFVSDKQISKYNLTHWRRA